MTTNNSVALAPFRASRVLVAIGCLLLCAGAGWLGARMAGMLTRAWLF